MWTIKYIKNDQLLKLYSIFSFHNLLKNPWIIRKLSDKKHLARPACILYTVLISKLSDLISLTHTYTQTDICKLSWTYFIDLWCQKYCTKVPKSLWVLSLFYITFKTVIVHLKNRNKSLVLNVVILCKSRLELGWIIKLCKYI